MPKSKGHKKRPKPKSTSNQTVRPARRWTIARIVALAISALGALAAITTFLPRITIDPPEPFDPTSDASGIFEIKNEGVVDLRDVDVVLKVCFFTTAPLVGRGDCSGSLPTFGRTDWHRDALEMDKTITVSLDEEISVRKPAAIGSAEIALMVSYRPWFWPWKREFEERFKTKVMNDGRIYWYSTPYN